MKLTQIFCSKVGDLTKKYSNLPETYIKRAMEQVKRASIISFTFKSIFFRLYTGALENSQGKAKLPAENHSTDKLSIHYKSPMDTTVPRSKYAGNKSTKGFR